MRICQFRLTMSIAVLSVVAAADTVQAFHIVRSPVVRQRTVIRGGAVGGMVVGSGESFFVSPTESLFLESAFIGGLGAREFAFRSASETALIRQMARESVRAEFARQEFAHQEAARQEREAAAAEGSTVAGTVGGGLKKTTPPSGDSALVAKMDSIVTRLDNINTSLNNILKAVEKMPPAKIDEAAINRRISDEVAVQLDAALAKLPKPEPVEKIVAGLEKALQPKLEEQKKLIEEIKANQIDRQDLGKLLRAALGNKAEEHKALLDKLEKKN
jgi:hypothetical protein